MPTVFLLFSKINLVGRLGWPYQCSILDVGHWYWLDSPTSSTSAQQVGWKNQAAARPIQVQFYDIFHISTSWGYFVYYINDHARYKWNHAWQSRTVKSCQQEYMVFSLKIAVNSMSSKTKRSSSSRIAGATLMLEWIACYFFCAMISISWRSLSRSISWPSFHKFATAVCSV
jgi:hypothetical protein